MNLPTLPSSTVRTPAAALRFTFRQGAARVGASRAQLPQGG